MMDESKEVMEGLENQKFGWSVGTYKVIMNIKQM
jgi:hypothetical protein